MDDGGNSTSDIDVIILEENDVIQQRVYCRYSCRSAVMPKINRYDKMLLISAHQQFVY